MEKQTKWLTTEEAAAYLGITRTCIYEWRARGMGPRYYKLQRQLRYKLEDLEEFLQRCARPGGMNSPRQAG